LTTEARILVVDDHDDTAEMLAAYLKRHGYLTDTASSATEALEKVKAESFDLIISDIAMPVMSGYELVEELRRMRDYRRTPTIAVTGFAMQNDRERSLQAGFNAHMTKPINPQTLLHTVNRLLGK
jgi:CheY-like chemotaxis protein